MGTIADSFGFGAETSEADTAEFESTTTGDAKRAAESGSKDDGTDNAGWDADTDVKDLAGAGDDPAAKPAAETKVDADPEAKKKLDEAAAAKKAKDGEGDDNDDDDDPKGEELPDGIKRRIARANRARDREKERADTAEREAETLRRQVATQTKAEDKPAAAPKAEDFDDYEDYLQAKQEFEKKPAPKKDEPKPADATTEQKPDREVVTAVAEVKALLTEAGHGDVFDQIVKAGEKVPVPRDVVIALADPEAFDHPESVLQALLDDPENAVKLAQMTPAARMKRLVAFDQPYKAAEKGEDGKPKPAPKLSDAPPPIDQTNGNAKGAKDYDAMPFSEFEQVRNAEVAKTKDFW